MAEKRTTTRKSSNSKASTLSRNAAAAPIDLKGTGHGISYPKYDANQYIAPDLFSDSSNAPRMSDAESAEALASIAEKENALKVADANIGLNTLAVGVADSHAKFEGKLIDFATTQVQNAAKLIGYQTAEIARDTAAVQRDTAGIKLEISQQKLEQERLNLAGESEATARLADEWERKKQIQSQRLQALDLQIQEGTRQLGLSARKLNAIDTKAS